MALHEDGDRCRFNFGAEPFLFDIAAFAVSDARSAGVIGGGELPTPETEDDDSDDDDSDDSDDE